MKKGYLWGIIVVLIAIIAGQLTVITLYRSSPTLSIPDFLNTEKSANDALLVNALGENQRDRSKIFEFVRTFQAVNYPTVRPPSSELKAHTATMRRKNESTLPWLEKAQNLQNNAKPCAALEVLMEGIQTDRTYLAFLIDDIDNTGFPLIEAILESDCADQAIPFISAMSIASADPIAYLQNLLKRMPEEQINTIWEDDPYVIISNFEEEETLQNVTRAIDYQDREVLEFSQQSGTPENDAESLRIQAGKPNRDGPLLVGWQELFLNLSPGAAGLRVYANSNISEPLKMAVDVVGKLSNGQQLEQLLRVPVPTPLESGTLLFDTASLGDSLFNNAVSQFGRLQPWFLQGMSAHDFLDAKLHMSFIGLDIPSTMKNNYYIERIELYLPQDTWHIPPPLPDTKEFQLNLHPAPEQQEGASGDTDTQEHFERLQAIGYLDAVSVAPKESGVVTHKPEKAHPGYNFFQSGNSSALYLMDMEGQVVHTWQPEPGDKHYNSLSWRRSHLYPNGDVLAVQCDRTLLKMDKDSNILWEKPKQGYHHDMRIQDDGRIYILSRQWEKNPLAGLDAMSLVDYVEILNPEGKTLQKISILEALEDSPYAPLLRHVDYNGDVFHTNSIQVLDGQLSDSIPAFQEGNVLLCLLGIDFIGVLDMEKEIFTWSLTGQWNFQHDPKLLPNDRMLLFDNLGPSWHRMMYPASRVVEFDPITREETWEYRGSPEQPFFSRTCGAAWSLPNGNFLITETNGGRVLELTREKEIVWEYINPVRTGEDDKLIPVIKEMIRYPEDYIEDWLSL